MKTKTLNKKLTLSKETIINLNEDKMNNIKGGYPLSTGSHCFECRTYEC